MKHIFLLGLIAALSFGTMTSLPSVATSAVTVIAPPPPPPTSIVCIALQQSKSWKDFVLNALRNDVQGLRNANISQNTPERKAKFDWATNFLTGGSALQMTVMYLTVDGFNFNETAENISVELASDFNDNIGNITGYP